MLEENGYVLIIGSSNMDLNIYLKHFPNPGETVTGGIFKKFLGGKGANQAVASVRSGSKTIFIGKIGTDLFGDQMVSTLANEGINTDHLIRDSKDPSGVAFILIDENGENMISVAPGANVNLKPEEVRSKTQLIKNANSVVVQMEIPIKTIQEVFNVASEGNCIKILNPAPLKHLPVEILRNVDIVIPNEGELSRLHNQLGFKNRLNEGKQKIVQISRDIADLGVEFIITTLGNKGSIIFEKKTNKFFEIAAPTVHTVDTVGAGDCFIGVLASFLNKGETILNAVKFATVAASIAVTRKGAQESMPYLSEILNKFKELNLN
ncbi:MAG: ribokinase [Promethearchaeota archaeon]